MSPSDWGDPAARTIAVYLDGADDPDRAADGTPLIDDDFLLLINAWWQPLDVALPATRADPIWNPEIDTYEPSGIASPANITVGEHITVRPRSIVVLRASRKLGGS
jgi:isoamylase